MTYARFDAEDLHERNRMIDVGALGKSVIPAGSSGSMKDKASEIKASMGNLNGRQSSDGASERLLPGMKSAIDKEAKSQGQKQGVQTQDGATLKQSQAMRKAIGEAASSRGQEVGKDAKDAGGNLSKEQRQAMIDTTVKPKVNPSQASDSDDKGGNKGGGMTDKQRADAKKEIDKLFKPFEKIAKETKPSPMVAALEKLLKNPPKPPK